MQLSLRRSLALIVGCGTALALGACANKGSDGADSEGLTVSTSVTPTVEKQDTAPTEPIVADTLYGKVEDKGMGVAFHFQGAAYGPYGGTVITVAVTNNNDAPLAPDVLDPPTLKYNTGGGEMRQVELLQTQLPEGAAPIQRPIDLPLGVGATTNVQYTFDVAQGNLWDAEFKFGNVIWQGNLTR